MSLSTPLEPDVNPNKESPQTGELRFRGIPRFVYGTAFKGDRSTELVELALRQGFSGIDTASHSRNYQEKLVGDGIRNVLAEKRIQRGQIYVRYPQIEFHLI